MKYMVECQALVKYEIEADGIDWCISAYEQRREDGVRDERERSFND